MNRLYNSRLITFRQTQLSYLDPQQIPTIKNPHVSPNKINQHFSTLHDFTLHREVKSVRLL